MRVLVIEDYAPLRTSLARGLREDGYAVDDVADGIEGLAYAESGDYDTIILDVMLPGLDGFSILERLRKQGNDSRILLLTAKDAVADRVAGLDRGADDYLVKPFAFEELKARVRALVRKRYGRRASTIRIADLELDTVARVVRRGDVRIDLTAREYSILEALAHRRGHVVTREQIAERIYDLEADRGSNVVDVYIGYLRRKLEDGGRSRLIHTRRGLGYVLDAED